MALAAPPPFEDEEEVFFSSASATTALSVPVTCTRTPPMALNCESTEAISAAAPLRPQEATLSAMACVPVAVKVPALLAAAAAPLSSPPSFLSSSCSSVCAIVEVSA